MNSATADKLRVYLVEDNAELLDETLFVLNAYGIDALGFGAADQFYRVLAVQPCDIVVIDVGLPGEDGFSIAEHLRPNSAMGIVFLTARSSLGDRLRGLNNGADAYLVKPFDVCELVAILQALGRRVRATPRATLAPVPVASRNAVRVEPSLWRLTGGGWILRDPDGRELSLTDNERRFLEIMFAAADVVVGRESLITAFAAGEDYDPHRLDSIISRLRKRVEQAGLAKLPLKAVRGTGYAFAA